MKILFVSPHPGFGGSSSANRNIAQMIASLGHEVVYIDEYLPEDINIKGCKINKTPIHKGKFYKRHLFSDFLDNNNFDVIFIGVPIIGLYYYNLFIKQKRRGVHICMIYHSLSLSKGFTAIIDEQMINIASSVATHLFFVSNFTKESWSKYRFIRRLRNNSFVVYNAVSPQPLPQINNSNLKRISFVGRLSPEKGPELFCKSAFYYLRYNRDCSFHIYGDGPLLSQLKERYEKFVEFHGFESDMSKVYAETDILVMTSEFENCPMAILEAGSYGIPCVAPMVGGIPEIVIDGKNGYLFEDRDEKSISSLLDKIFSSYSSFSQKAYIESRKYFFERIRIEWNNIISQMFS